MSKVIGCILLVLLTTRSLYSQRIIVKDAQSGEPLSSVTIADLLNQTVIFTDEQGMADLSGFKKEIKLSLSLLGYESIRIINIFPKKKRNIIQLNPVAIVGKEVTVASKKLRQRKLDLPAYIEQIDLSEISNSSVQTTADLVGTANGVYIQKSQQGGGSPMLRGFAANRILIVVDGVRFNHAIFRSGNLQNILSIDPEVLDQAEVLFGPNSLIYGSDALGGVIHLHTKSTPFEDGFSAKIGLGFQSANNERTAQLSASYGAKNWSYRGQLSANFYGDLLMGTHGSDAYLRPTYQLSQLGLSSQDSVQKNDNPRRQKDSFFNQRFTHHTIKFRANDKNTLQYQFFYSTTSDIPRYDRLIRMKDQQFVHATWYYGPQRWMMHSLKWSSATSRKLYSGFELTAAYQNNHESRHDRKFNDFYLRNRRERIKVYSTNIDFNKQLSNQLEIRYGAELIYNKINSSAWTQHVLSGAKFPIQTRYPDGSVYRSAACYIQGSKIFNTITLSGGLRYQYSDISADFSSSVLELNLETLHTKNTSLVGSMGISSSFGDALFVYTNVSSGFRAPNVDDIAKVFDSEPGRVIVPNPKLKAEQVINAEIGLQSRVQRPVDYHFSFYYTRLYDLMTRKPFTINGQDSLRYDGVLSEIYAIQNTNQGYIYGTEIALAYQNNFLKLSANISYQKGQEKTSDGFIPIRHIVPLNGSLELKWYDEHHSLSMRSRYSAAFKYSDLAPSEIAKAHLYASDTAGRPFVPAWWTLDLLATKRLHNWSMDIGMYNIFDKRYRPYSSGISAAGRHVGIHMTRSF